MKPNTPFAEKSDLTGTLPESWACIDCGINTAPGLSTREQMERAFAADWNNQGVKQTIDEFSEVYMVKTKIWKAVGMDAMGGCLCIACLEKRLGRTLMPKDFKRNHPFSQLPETERLMARRDNAVMSIVDADNLIARATGGGA
jgi:hypothetical protein